MNVPREPGRWRAAGALAAFATLLLAAPAAAGNLEMRAFAAVAARDVYVEPSVASLVDQARLAYAARTASHAADGARVKVLFVDVPSRQLNGFRDRMFSRLGLGPRGALVVATPAAVTIRTHTLTSDQENGIVALDAHLFKRRHAGYTEPIAELVYDVGLVIHNSRPGVAPRGAGADRDLSTFSGSFPDERAQPMDGDAVGGSGWLGWAAVAWIGAALAGLVAYAARRRRRFAG